MDFIYKGQVAGKHIADSLKGFIDRTFLPGKLLTDKTARLIVTMDAPKWYYSLMTKSSGHNSMKKGILEFCGVKPVKITVFGAVKAADQKKI